MTQLLEKTVKKEIINLDSFYYIKLKEESTNNCTFQIIKKELPSEITQPFGEEIEELNKKIKININDYKEILKKRKTNSHLKNEQLPKKTKQDYYVNFFFAKEYLEFYQNISTKNSIHLQNKFNQLKEYIILSNTGSILSQVKKYTGMTEKNIIDSNDLLQRGYMGVINALEKFDPNKATFSTYAARYIKQHMIDEIRKNNCTIRIPVSKLRPFYNDSLEENKRKKVELLHNTTSIYYKSPITGEELNVLDNLITPESEMDLKKFEKQEEWNEFNKLFFQYFDKDDQKFLLETTTETCKKLGEKYKMTDSGVYLKKKRFHDKIIYCSEIRKEFEKENFNQIHWENIAKTFLDLSVVKMKEIMNYFEDDNLTIPELKKSYFNTQITDFLTQFYNLNNL